MQTCIDTTALVVSITEWRECLSTPQSDLPSWTNSSPINSCKQSILLPSGLHAFDGLAISNGLYLQDQWHEINWIADKKEDSTPSSMTYSSPPWLQKFVDLAMALLQHHCSLHPHLSWHDPPLILYPFARKESIAGIQMLKQRECNCFDCGWTKRDQPHRIVIE